MADEKPPPEFMSALVTEHFVLQGTSSSTVSESGSRVSIYLSSLSSGLVAIGFASSSPRALESLAFTVLPVVFILGWFTVVRLTDTSVANLVSQRRMDLIRQYYATIYPPAARYFGPADPAYGRHGVQYGRWSFLFTMSSMVIVVNSVVGGAALALVAALAAHAPSPVPAVIGIVAGLILLAWGLYYERRRLMPVVLSSPNLSITRSIAAAGGYGAAECGYGMEFPVIIGSPDGTALLPVGLLHKTIIRPLSFLGLELFARVADPLHPPVLTRGRY